MLHRIDALREELTDVTLTTLDEAEDFRITYLGQRSGIITNLFKKIGQVAPADRPTVGKQLNALKQRAEAIHQEAVDRLEQAAGPAAPDVDLTLPGRTPRVGSVHPLAQTLHDITRLFERFGFAVAEGPEIEDDWHNFTALNFPPEHPARDMQDTFFVEPPEGPRNGVVLRTHTSPVQIRVMENTAPPVRIIAPGRVYRNEAISYKSFCLFHQVEGLYVDEGVTLGDLKHILRTFAEAFFGADVQMRFRSSYFPFTEPSAEVDIWWADPEHPDGGRWMEILGSGMVHPNVLEAVGADPERYTGYAFGMGVERIAMLRYGIDDIRTFYENDVRFLQQF